MTEEHRELPKFSRRLGAPIATIRPVGKPPSQVTGRPDRQAHQPPAAAEEPQTNDDGAELTPVTSPQERTHLPPALRPMPTDLGVMPGPDGSPMPAEPDPDAVNPESFYAQVGGRQTFQKIVDVFYDQVAEDPDFRAMYPEEDLGPAKERLLLFLEQYWGGPRAYQQQRGHPRLRMRHMPFRVDAEARDKWLRFMRKAVDAAELSPLHEQVLWDYLERAAHSMVNA